MRMSLAAKLISKNSVHKQTSASHILVYSNEFFIKLVLRRSRFWRISFCLPLNFSVTSDAACLFGFALFFWCEIPLCRILSISYIYARERGSTLLVLRLKDAFCPFANRAPSNDIYFLAAEPHSKYTKLPCLRFLIRCRTS
ncbi:hypothetical protein BJX63DRAFT_157946 [Aspergillus granulosus]|uniref:Uncharacterized protein n=1 Tax=Aspergillus granulosus TaxID=176169 RepID=A0ABR4GRH4_9EURO